MYKNNKLKYVKIRFKLLLKKMKYKMKMNVFRKIIRVMIMHK